MPKACRAGRTSEIMYEARAAGLIEDLEARLRLSPYQAYSYSYPHKTAYRPLDPAVELAPVWAAEDRSALFLYVHVPFCEMRCGFCNLFTLTRPDGDLAPRYLAALDRQADMMTAILGEHRFARIAIGGGTPTQLSLREMERLLAIVQRVTGRGETTIPLAVEVSPGTIDQDKMALLAAFGTQRVSIGIQSFVETELRALARPQANETVEQALALLRAAAFPIVNLDLIYGIPGQTVESWLWSLERALSHAPDELYLYPLYVRPLTGLGKRSPAPEAADDIRLLMYRKARDLLLDRGWIQSSMRLFRARPASLETLPYSCQEDGMVGLGPGARSYTQHLHYSTDFAVGRRSIQEIIENYCETSDAAFAQARHGVHLTAAEQKRRFAIQSILDESGLDLAAYRQRFSSEAMRDFPEIALLQELGFGRCQAETVTLTPRGLELADAIGPWLTSPDMTSRMRGFALR